jgi:hypothetical protein
MVTEGQVIIHNYLKEGYMRHTTILFVLLVCGLLVLADYLVGQSERQQNTEQKQQGSPRERFLPERQSGLPPRLRHLEHQPEQRDAHERFDPLTDRFPHHLPQRESNPMTPYWKERPDRGSPAAASQR